MEKSVDVQILELLKEMQKEISKIADIIVRIYGADLEETEADPDAPEKSRPFGEE